MALFKLSITKTFLLLLLFYIFDDCHSKPYRTVTVVQKSAGITVLYPELPEATKPPLEIQEPKNNTENNATKLIENVLNSVVQSSMNDMLLKLTNSLGDLFSMFTAATSRHSKQKKDEIVGTSVVKSHNDDGGRGGGFDPSKFDSLLNTEEQQRLEKVRQDDDKSIFQENNAENIVNGGGSFEETNYFENEQLQNKTWWRNILMKILKTNKLAEEESHQQQQLSPLIVLSTTANPNVVLEDTSEMSTKESILNTLVKNVSTTLVMESLTHQLLPKYEGIPHFPQYEKDNTTVDEYQISPTPEQLEINVSTTFDEENDFNHQVPFATTPGVDIDGKKSLISSAPMWELLIRLENGLEGRLKNVTSTDGGVTSRKGLVLENQIAAAKSILITGDPDQDSMSTKLITPLPNRPLNKSNNLFFQTVLISCAAVFAIFVFSCFGVALACYGKKRKRRNAPGKFGPDSRGLPRLVDPATIFSGGRRPIFKTVASSPYYYDSAASRSDWSLMSRDRDRQVETYFATASVLNGCDSSSPSASSGGGVMDGCSSAASAAAILH